MKKIFISMIAVAAVAACAKTEVAYEAPEAISFKAVNSNVTKTTGPQSGTFADNMVVYAQYMSGDDASNNEAWWSEPKVFVKQGTTPGTWKSTDATWPQFGGLQFAGYSISDETTTANVAYSYDNNQFVFTDYSTSNQFDLGYFLNTETFEKEEVHVTFKHALAQVLYVSDDSSIEIVSVKLVDTPTTASTLTINNSGVTAATSATEDDVTINTTGVLVLPGTASQVEVVYRKKIVGETWSAPQKVTTTEKPVATWVAGKKYSYNITVAEYTDAMDIVISAEWTEWVDEDGKGNTLGGTVEVK
jgi:hypothetical protein